MCPLPVLIPECRMNFVRGRLSPGPDEPRALFSFYLSGGACPSIIIWGSMPFNNYLGEHTSA